VNQRPFADHYEVLQVSPNADTDTIERVYRHLAKRYHPDNQATGHAGRFAEVQNAFNILGHPEKRAAYDVRYEENRGQQWKIFDQESAADSREEDRRIFHGILSLLYAAKRQDPIVGGLGVVHMERMLGVSQKHLEFPLWYLKSHGWIEIQDNGQYAITVSGVDKITSPEMELPRRRLLNDSSLNRDEASPAPAPPRPMAVNE
jgi:curved DNA-binding protein CbpA